MLSPFAMSLPSFQSAWKTIDTAMATWRTKCTFRKQSILFIRNLDRRWLLEAMTGNITKEVRNLAWLHATPGLSLGNLVMNKWGVSRENRSLSLSYQKKDGCTWTRPSFFWYDTDFSEFDYADMIDYILKKSVSYPTKDGRSLLWVWQRQRP